MSSVSRFFLLDCITIKPFLKPRNLIIILLLAIIGNVLMGGLGIVFILPVIINISAYLFSAGKDGLDCLYATLSIKRMHVVIGRYLSSMFLTIIFLLAYFILGYAISFILGHEFSLVSFFSIILTVFFIATFFNFINLPALFKLGFKKSKLFVGIFPTVIILGILLMLHIYGIDMNYLATPGYTIDLGQILLFDGFSESRLAIILGAIVFWLLASLSSLLISIKLYNRRSF